MEGSELLGGPKAAWRMATTLSSHLQIGQEHQLRTLFRRFVFSPKYLDPTEVSLASLAPSLAQVGLEESGPSGVKLDRKTLDGLCMLYEDLVLLPKMLDKSQALSEGMCYSVTSQTLGSNGETVLPGTPVFLN